MGPRGEQLGACRGHTSWVRAVVALGGLTAGGSFASGSSDESIRAWASDGSVVRVVDVGQWVLSLSLSPGQDRVAAGCAGGFVKLFRLPGWDQVWSVQAHDLEVMSVSWGARPGRLLATGSLDLEVKILSVETGATLRTFRGHSQLVDAVLFCQDGNRILSKSSDSATVHVWRIFSKAERRVRGARG
jgi:WD40 repeat protein